MLVKNLSIAQRRIIVAKFAKRMHVTEWQAKDLLQRAQETIEECTADDGRNAHVGEVLDFAYDLAMEERQYH